MTARTIVAGASATILLSACSAGPPSATEPRGGNQLGAARSTSQDRAGSTSKDRSRLVNDFTVQTFEGATFSLARQRRIPVVLNFWESW
ncbi:MAG: hypothetical protein M3346_08515 [Actinomycetota bacterium]|nr:hypothetical protein [Actinomycetota bacterium]